VNAAVSSPLGPQDVTASWAGLRPLLATADAHGRVPGVHTADLSRRHKVERSASGLITVTGGKLTTYRKMAADTVDAVQRELGSRIVASRTKNLRLRGSEPVNALQVRELADKLGLDAQVLDHLQRRYGGEMMAVLGLGFDRPELRERLVEGLEHLEAEVVYAARFEMAHLRRGRPVAPYPCPPARRPIRRPLAAVRTAECWQPSSAGAPFVRAKSARRFSGIGQHDLAAAASLADQAFFGPGDLSPRARRAQGGASADRDRPSGAARSKSGSAVSMSRSATVFLERLSGACAIIDVSPDSLAEAGRDWWPISLRWALSGAVPARPGVIARPADTAEVAGVLRCCNEAGIPVTAAGGRSGVCGGAVPIFVVSVSIAAVSAACRRFTVQLRSSMSEPALSGTISSTSFAPLMGSRSATGPSLSRWRPSEGRSRVAVRASTPPATERSRTWSPVSKWFSPTGPSCARARWPDEEPGHARQWARDLMSVFVGSEGTLGVITSARLRAHPGRSRGTARSVGVPELP